MFEGDEFASYATPDATADIFASIHMCFELIPKCWILRRV
jgi:hypothetical protein